MQLHARLRAPCDQTRRRIEDGLPPAVQGDLVLLEERYVHHAREQALDPQIAADEAAHQIADRRVLAERDQRSEIAVAPWLERAPGEAPLDLSDHVRCHLVRRLRARRNGHVLLAEPRTGGA